jgi:putative lipoprotein
VIKLRTAHLAALPLLAAAWLGGCAQTPQQQTAAMILAADVGSYGRLPRAGVPPQPPEAPQVHGTLFYRERVALPPGTVAEIELVENRKNGAVVAATRVPVTGQVPVPFVLVPPAAALKSTVLYALRARLVADGKVLFQTETPRPVAVSAAAGPVDVQLVAARR